MPLISSTKKEAIGSMWILFEILTNIFQGCLMILFIKARLSIHRKNYTPEIISIFLIAVFLSGYQYLPFTIPDVFVFTIPLIYGLLNKKAKWQLSVYWTLVLGIIFNTVTSLWLGIFSSIPGCSF